jgi:hypothetical protein
MALPAMAVRQRTPPRLLKSARPPDSLRGEIILAAAAGDATAWSIIETLIPTELPPGVVRRARDHAIQGLATMLGAMMPGTSLTRLARWVAEAGAALDLGHSSSARALPFLTASELAGVDREISKILAWLTPRRDGSRWPGRRQIFDILHGLAVR